jgi:hypothetical protein
MKPMMFLLAATCFTLGAVSAATPPKGADSPEVEYLRRLIAEQQKNPDKIIRTLPATNAPAATNAAAARKEPPAAATAESPKSAPPPGARATTDNAPTPEEAARQKKISEVEARLDEMLRQKEAREKAALTNAAATNQTSATPLTKRQRLDDLLRQMIDGKITAAEYSQRREKIIAEPD